MDLFPTFCRNEKLRKLRKIDKINHPFLGKINITGSKSETNRLLILQQLYPEIKIENASNSDDSVVLQEALSTNNENINIGHAGTAMRFLTAFFASKEGCEKILTGSERMKNRPIKILVEALRKLGANIEYLGNDGFPPLKIKGNCFQKSKVCIDGSVSSQYISALLLIAPKLSKGLQVEFVGKITSVPYIKMTLQLLEKIGIEYLWNESTITILPKKNIDKKTIVVESDWSSASYFYSAVALQPNSELELTSYKKNSLQGDAVLADIYTDLGVETLFKKDSIVLKNTEKKLPKNIHLNLSNAPDIAQTIAVTCLGLGIECYLTGLHTLKIKETDRLVALKNEIGKLGGNVVITKDSLLLKKSDFLNENVSIKTYNDHRMAMAFAPLATKVPIIIENAEVVSKSYPDFWADFQRISS